MWKRSEMERSTRTKQQVFFFSFHKATSPDAEVRPQQTRQSELQCSVSVAVGQDSSRRAWTTNADTRFLGSLGRPIKGVYRRLPHDVIPAPNAKLITTMDPGMWMCVKNSTCQSKPLSVMSLELEGGIIKHSVCAGKGHNHKRLWWVSFFPLLFLDFFSVHISYQSLEKSQVAAGMWGDRGSVCKGGSERNSKQASEIRYY